MVVCEGPEEAPSWCSRRPRRGLQWVFRDLFPHCAGGAEQANWWWWWLCVFFFGPPGPPKRVLGSGRPVRGDGGDDGGGESDGFRWFLDLNRPLKTRFGGVRPVVSNF